MARDALLALAPLVPLAALLASAVLLLLLQAHSVAETAVSTRQIPPPLTNATLDTQTYDTPYGFNDDSLPAGFDCCNRWSKYQESTETKRNWFDALVVYDWKSFQPWWSKTSVMNWLYQSSLITPMQRWLEKINLYMDVFSTDVHIDSIPRRVDRCEGNSRFSERRCVRQWLNLSKLSVFMASVSDR